MGRQIGGPEIERLIALLARLPGLGPRSARKAALHLVKRREELMQPLARALAEVAERILVCSVCHNIDTTDPCSICADPKRDRSLLIVVEDVGDLWALERAGVARAHYHVLGGHISPLDGVGPEDLAIASLLGRVKGGEVGEVLLALNATVEGQATVHYLLEQLAGSGVKVSRLAHGVPVGGELDYLDEGTLGAAIRTRQTLEAPSTAPAKAHDSNDGGPDDDDKENG